MKGIRDFWPNWGSRVEEGKPHQSSPDAPRLLKDQVASLRMQPPVPTMSSTSIRTELKPSGGASEDIKKISEYLSKWKGAIEEFDPNTHKDIVSDLQRSSDKFHPLRAGEPGKYAEQVSKMVNNLTNQQTYKDSASWREGNNITKFIGWLLGYRNHADQVDQLAKTLGEFNVAAGMKDLPGGADRDSYDSRRFPGDE